MRGRDGMRNVKDTILLVGLLLVTTAVSPCVRASTHGRNVITAKSAILIDDQSRRGALATQPRPAAATCQHDQDRHRDAGPAERPAGGFAQRDAGSRASAAVEDQLACRVEDAAARPRLRGPAQLGERCRGRHRRRALRIGAQLRRAHECAGPRHGRDQHALRQPERTCRRTITTRRRAIWRRCSATACATRSSSTS